MSIVGKVVSYGVRQGKIATKEALNCWRYPIDVYQGAKVTNQLCKAKNAGVGSHIVAQSSNLLQQTGKHLPGLLSAVATPIPFPGTTALGFGLGKVLQKLIKLI